MFQVSQEAWDDLIFHLATFFCASARIEIYALEYRTIQK